MKNLTVFLISLLALTGIYAQTNTANIPQQLTVTDIDETSAYLSWLKDTSAYEYIV